VAKTGGISVEGIEELRLGRHGHRLADPDRFRMAQTGL